MGKYFTPLKGDTVIACERSVRIEPTGALLKYSLVAPSSSGLPYVATWLGNVPALANALSCCSGAVSHEARAEASSGCADCFGTVRYEPPQLPPPPGKTLAMSQPFVSGALPLMTPSI